MKPRLAIDWNNTIQDQISEIIRKTRQDFGHELTLADFSVWDAPLGHRLGLTHAEWVDYAWLSRDIQWNAKPYPGAALAIHLLSQYYDIMILSATCHPDMLEDWLHVNGIIYNCVCFSSAKTDIEWDVLIDDSPIVLRACNELGRRVVKRHIPWNSSIHSSAILYEWYRVIWLDRLIMLAGGFNE